MDSLTVLAIDPGKMTGLCIYRRGEITAGYADAASAADIVHWHIQDFKTPGIIVIEGWTPTIGAKTFQPEALELIGFVRYSCSLNRVPWIKQHRSNAKKIFPDAKLKELNLHHTKPNATLAAHKNDATRHLLLALRTHYFDTFRELEERCTQ